jgi:hypothetical protein
MRKNAPKPSRKRVAGVKVLASGEIRISVKDLHRAIHRLLPAFQEAHKRKPQIGSIGDIVTTLESLKKMTDCQRTMTMSI